MKLSELCTIGTNMSDADFWIQNVGNINDIGKPDNQHINLNAIGVKVNRTDILHPQYLYYWFTYLHMEGYFKDNATGISDKKLTIKTIADIELPIEDDGTSE